MVWFLQPAFSVKAKFQIQIIFELPRLLNPVVSCSPRHALFQRQSLYNILSFRDSFKEQWKESKMLNVVDIFVRDTCLVAGLYL